jgi:hypothetical protein
MAVPSKARQQLAAEWKRRFYSISSSKGNSEEILDTSDRRLVSSIEVLFSALRFSEQHRGLVSSREGRKRAVAVQHQKNGF